MLDTVAALTPFALRIVSKLKSILGGGGKVSPADPGEADDLVLEITETRTVRVRIPGVREHMDGAAQKLMEEWFKDEGDLLPEPEDVREIGEIVAEFVEEEEATDPSP